MKISIKILFFFTILIFILISLPTPKKREILDIQDTLQIVKEPPLEIKILNSMTLEEKVGQLFIFGFNGTNINENTKDLIEKKHIGGVLLLSKNIKNVDQLTKLNKQLQDSSEIPLLISIDQEGGTVSRIKWEDVLTISPKSMGNEKSIYDISTEKSALLRKYGINVNLAPVVEYITNTKSFLYPRVFTGTKQDVAKKASFAIKGYTDSGMISVAKHYPGHSNSSVDSHYNLPSVNISKEDFLDYIYPFKYLIEKELVDVIMVGHTLFPKIDKKPSTVSKILINDTLRDTLGYKGVVITDDMQMGAIEKDGELCNIAIEALNAGNDMLLYSLYTPRPNLQTEVYDCVLDAVKNGKINKKSVDEKVVRILQLKIKYELIDESIQLPQ